MATTATKLVLIAALMATGACAKKKPPILPPAPVDSSIPTDPDAGQNGGGGATDGAGLPGSQADFRRSVTSDTVLFGLDAFDIDPEARAILDTQAQWLQRYPNVRISVEGHCDERGTREYNLALGERRANAAKNYLAARGVDASRITTISYGKERPAAMGSDESSYAQNRRAVTVTVQ